MINLNGCMPKILPYLNLIFSKKNIMVICRCMNPVEIC